MSEYIERDAACVYKPPEKMERRYSTYNLDDAFEDGYDEHIKQVAAIPAADVVPVVRCRDCKWWVREGNDSYGYAMFCDHDCSLGGQGIKKPTDYCSYGERKGWDE